MARALVLALGVYAARSARVRQQSDVTCSPLHNAGSHSTVKVSIGTPPQTFNLVADTGSDSVIVKSCACVQYGSCKNDTPCFRGGGGQDSTFHLKEKPVTAQITFGSGPITAVVASDVVAIGGTTAKMDESVLLMIDKQLNFEEDLQGIIGLGVPKDEPKLGELSVGHGFFETAHVSRFSMCFNEKGRDGVLMFGKGIKLEKPLAGVGKAHWGLDFRGVSVGKAAASKADASKAAPVGSFGEAAFCDEGSMKPGQTTPCGAIVDSGTTLIMAPMEHIAMLFVQICEGWATCRKSPLVDSMKGQGSSPQEDLAAGMIKAFLKLAEACEDMDSLPSLFFHVRGQDGAPQTVELGPNDYIIEAKKHVSKLVRKWLWGIIPMAVPESTGDAKKICIPAFKDHKMNTQVNGPVWILGSPFFYKYTVAYNREAAPPAISFNEASCAPCEQSSSLLSLRGSTSGRRVLDAAPRVPFFFNTTQSL